MANVYAVKSGNWSDTTVWNTGALPASVDAVFSNNFTVTVDGTFTVASISNLAQSPAVAGGGFAFANGADLTANININAIWTGTNLGYLLGFTLAAPSSAIFRGNVTNSGSTARDGRSLVLHSGSGTLTIVGNLTRATQYADYCVRLNGTGTLNVVGNIVPTITGTNAASFILSNASSGTINLTGSVTGGAGGNDRTFVNLSNGTVNITGTVTGASGDGISNDSTGNIVITGDCFGGSSANSFAFNNTSTGTITHTGTLNASTNSPAAGGSATGICYLSGPFIGTPQGVAANAVHRWRWTTLAGSSYQTAVNSTATGYKNLYTSDSTLSQSGQPAASNVRSGTVYGPASELTGTCAVPLPGNVALSVPVDNTTGTAVLSAAAVKEACSKAVVPALLALG